MLVLGSILTYLILAVTLVLAAAVAGLMAYHYTKARLRERKGYSYDPETDNTTSDTAAEQRAKSAEEIANIRARIEALMEQQHMRSETQSQHLAQKLDDIRTHMQSQDHKMDGIKSELRHEIRRRDSELEDLRHQLASALDAFWKSMPALPEGASGDSLALPPASEPAPLHTGDSVAAATDVDPFELVEASEPAMRDDAGSIQPVPQHAPPARPARVIPPAAPSQGHPLMPEDPSPWTLPAAPAAPPPPAPNPFAEFDAMAASSSDAAAADEPDAQADSPTWAGARGWTTPLEPTSPPAQTPAAEAATSPVAPGTWSSPFGKIAPAAPPAESAPPPAPPAESLSPTPDPNVLFPEMPPFAPLPGPTSAPPPSTPAPPSEPPVAAEPGAPEAAPAWGAILDAAAVPTGEPSFAPPRAEPPAAPPPTPVPQAQAPPAPTPQAPTPQAPPAPAPAPAFSAPPEPAAPPSPPAAQPAPTPAPPTEGDDLTVITGIDEEIMHRLYLAGVTSLDEMARWSRADARRVSGAVGVSEETIMHQWIFEAQSVLFEHYQQQMAG